MIGKWWWTLSAVVLPIALLSCVTRPPASGSAPSAAAALRAPFVGQWAGTILVGSQAIQVQIRLEKGGNGAYVGRINIPEQDAYDLPLSDILVDHSRITFSLEAGSDTAYFDGTLKGDEIAGAFSQGPSRGTFHLGLASSLAVRSGGRGGGAVGSGGGSTAAPVETDGEPIQLRTPTGTIYGTLDLPDGAGPYPVVLIIAGSGPTNRDGNSTLLPGRDDCLKKLAIALKGAGFASVRYDKRGVGQSAAAGPDEAALRFDTYVGDAIAWVRMLKREPRFAGVAVVGHSEGSLIGMVAAVRANADAFVSLDGAGAPASVELKRQLAGLPPELRERAFGVIDSLVQGRLVPHVEAQLAGLFRLSVQPYLISWFRYDPTVEIAKLHVPILIVQGTHDLQIGVDDAKKLHEAAPGSQLAIIRGMNHVLVEAPESREGNLATYSEPDLPLAPDLVSTLVDFLRRALG